MRLWHVDILPFLPRSQLLAQWRELNSIFKKQDNHILINYIYDYQQVYLWEYAMAVVLEMKKRGYTIRSMDNSKNYFGVDFTIPKEIKGLTRFQEHNDEYFEICYYNLKEKYLRGQKDYTDAMWFALDEFYKEMMKSE